MANNDKIYEAYTGKFGQDMEEKTKARIEWILNHVGADKDILDIGCSQGIISLLMVEQNKSVYAIDIQKEAIEFANNLLETKFGTYKDRIQFICTDFMEFNQDIKVDTVVITEVLEHLEKPIEFLAHAKKFLKDAGKLVITVPFGVSDHPDHCSTFYLSNLVGIIEKNFQVEGIEYLGRWMGVIAKNSESINPFEYSKGQIARLEANFETIDWEMTKRIQQLYGNTMSASEKYRQALDNYSRAKEQHSEAYGALSEKYKVAEDNYVKIKESYTTIREKYQNVEDNYAKQKENYIALEKKYKDTLEDNNTIKAKNKILDEDKQEVIALIQKLYGDIDSEVQFLKENKALIARLETQNNYLKHENAEYRRKLSLITDTAIGKLGIKVYKLLKKIKAKLR